MANILGYLDEYGGKTLSEMPFGAVDNLILAQMAYGRYEAAKDILPSPFLNIEDAVKDGFRRLDAQLLEKICASARFKNAIPLAYESKLEEKDTLQFAAITYLLPDGTAYVAFRGTDNTLVGWKEDFNLSFTTPVPAQTEAVEYLNRVGDTLGCPLRVGGHSKGGNLAVYAAAYCRESIQGRIITAYSNDGPGHDMGTLRSEGYGRIANRVRTYIPKSSIVGILLEHGDNSIIVDSDARGVFQHNPYTWQLNGSDFFILNKTTAFSTCMNESIREWLKNLDNEKRKRMIDMVFDMLSAGDAKTVRELLANYKNLLPVLNAAKELDAEDRHELFELASQFMRIALSQYEQYAREYLSTFWEYLEDLKEKYIDRDDKKNKETGGGIL